VLIFATLLASAALGPVGPPPPWIQRALIPPPIVAWRLADVLGTPVVEGVAVSRDNVSRTVTVNVVDSRFDPPRVVRLRELPGTNVGWLRAGVRDGLARNEVALDTTGPKGEAAYLLRVGPRLTLILARTKRGSNLEPTAFSH
jgi:hypothetical protein